MSIAPINLPIPSRVEEEWVDDQGNITGDSDRFAVPNGLHEQLVTEAVGELLSAVPGDRQSVGRLVAAEAADRIALPPGPAHVPGPEVDARSVTSRSRAGRR